MRLALLLIACAALAGCQTVWAPAEPGSKTKADFQRESYECERDALPARDGIQAELMRKRCMRAKGWIEK